MWSEARFFSPAEAAQILILEFANSITERAESYTKAGKHVAPPLSVKSVQRLIHALVQVFAGALHPGEHGYTVADATPTRERKQGHMDKPDPYAELSAVMQDLAAQGVSEADIIDAAFRLAVTAAARLYGPEAVSHSLLDMAEVVRAATDPGAHWG
jgi:hypothetical protein